jgi:hypothetical protein
MNLVEAFKAGQKGSNKGLPMGEGLKNIDLAINGVQKGRIYTVGAPPKGGKSTMVDAGFVIEPAIYVLEVNRKVHVEMEEIKRKLEFSTDSGERAELNQHYDVLQSRIIHFEIIYNSYEIDRVSKEFDFLAHFINRDYGVETVMLPEGKTYRGKDHISLSPDFLKGEKTYDKMNPDEPSEIIKVPDSIFDMVKATYTNRIIPLFGEYDANGRQVTQGLIIFLENKENPTGIRNYLIDYAKKNGEFMYSSSTKDGVTHTRMTGYKPNNPDKYVLVVTDHLRKLIPERGFKMKETVDKFSEYSVELRNTCNFSFVHIIHLNRSMADAARMKQDGDRLFPKSDDIKETGNLSEDSNYIFTLFNPNDDRYQLNSHFGHVIKRADGSLIYPNLRTIHLVESRHCACPQHFKVNMYGEYKKFSQIIIR